MATTYLTRTPSSGAATQKATFSFWVKKTNTTGTPNLFRMYTNAQQYVRIRFESSNKISFIIINSDSYVVQLISTQVFRDTSAWYNIVCNMDTTQATASDRAKIYVNGERITAYDTATYPPTQNANITVTPSGTANHIGTQVGDSASYFEGCMSHINFTDGYVYQASEFGETDSTTGEWKIKTSPSVTYGTNGFFILKDGNSVTDQSGNSNNFTVAGGTLTNTKDCPDNVFSTLNPLIGASNQPTFTNGNTTVISPSGTNARYGGTLGMTSGKYYYEVKLLGSVTNGGFGAGILNIDSFNFNATSGISGSSNYIGATVNNNNLYIQHGGASNDLTPTVALGSIIGHAIDMDNGYYYVHVNGVYLNSGDPTSGSTGTGNLNRTGNLNYDFSTLTMVVGGSSQNVDYGSFNFGNGYFGTTAVTTNSGAGYAGTDGSSIFNYQPPTGYSALSTKGLNS